MAKVTQSAYGVNTGFTPIVQPVVQTRDPTNLDINYPLFQQWWNKTTQVLWTLNSFNSSSGTVLATWDEQSGLLTSLTGNSGGSVPADNNNNINLLGDTSTINIVGVPATHTLTVSTTGPYTPSTYTAHSVLVGEGSSSIAAVGPGTAGQVFVSGGASSDPSWQTMQVTVQTFTSNGTYTPTSGMKYCIIEVLGGGGGSGGCAAGGANYAATGGGGSGAYSKGIFSSSTIGASQSVTVGAAGSGGAAGNNPGTDGGSSSVGALISAGGGVHSPGGGICSYSGNFWFRICGICRNRRISKYCRTAWIYRIYLSNIRISSCCFRSWSKFSSRNGRRY